ncbi:MAG: ABC transporter substrate-binding protein [Undibacterium sp.]|nr:ABC transporter substrate-binding protein [Opitutaceae bacterium]
MRFVGDDLTQLTRGELAAMQGFATEEFVKLRRLVGAEARFLSFAELGFDSYSQLIYTTAPQLARHRETLRRFLAATRLGWLTALPQPETALAASRPYLDPATYDESFQPPASSRCATTLPQTISFPWPRSTPPSSRAWKKSVSISAFSKPPSPSRTSSSISKNHRRRF